MQNAGLSVFQVFRWGRTLSRSAPIPPWMDTCLLSGTMLYQATLRRAAIQPAVAFSMQGFEVRKSPQLEATA